MTPAELLTLAQAHDIVLDVQGDRLVVDAPTGALTPELQAELVRHKPALVALLTQTYVTLKNGPTVPLPALSLALDLERRGFRMSLDADEQLMIVPTSTLTDTDRAAIRLWRLHLRATVAYTPDAEDGIQRERPRRPMTGRTDPANGPKRVKKTGASVQMTSPQSRRRPSRNRCRRKLL